MNTCWAKCVGRGPMGPPGPEGFPLGLADPGLMRSGEKEKLYICNATQHCLRSTIFDLFTEQSCTKLF